jgi:hypothetical protein
VAWRFFVGGGTEAYSLTPAAWQELTARAAVQPRDGGPGAAAPGPPSGRVSPR